MTTFGNTPEVLTGAKREVEQAIKKSYSNFYLPENLNQVCCTFPTSTGRSAGFSVFMAPENPRLDSYRIFPELRDAWGRRSLLSNIDIGFWSHIDQYSRAVVVTVSGSLEICAFPSVDAESKKKETPPNVSSTVLGSISHMIPVADELARSLSAHLRVQRHAGLYYSARDYAVFRERLSCDPGADFCPTQFRVRFSCEMRFSQEEFSSSRRQWDWSYSRVLLDVGRRMESVFREMFTVSLHAVPVLLSRDMIQDDLAAGGPRRSTRIPSILELNQWQTDVACDFAKRESLLIAARQGPTLSIPAIPAPAPPAISPRPVASREVSEFRNAIFEFDEAAGIPRDIPQGAPQAGFFAPERSSRQRLREASQRASHRSPAESRSPVSQHSPIDPRDYQPPKRKIVLKKKPPEVAGGNT